MPTRRGTTNRLTGKTTPRSKPTTHWGRKASPKKSGKKAAPAGASKK